MPHGHDFRLVNAAVLRRCVVTAAIVGVLLFAVNQGPSVFFGPWTGELAARFAATMCIPFGVSLASAALTRLDLRHRASSGSCPVCGLSAVSHR